MPARSRIVIALGILVLDADELISREDLGRLRQMTSGNDLGVKLLQRTYENDSHFTGWKRNRTRYPEGRGFAGYIDSPLVRFFRKGRGIGFQGKVHELTSVEEDTLSK